MDWGIFWLVIITIAAIVGFTAAVVGIIYLFDDDEVFLGFFALGGLIFVFALILGAFTHHVKEDNKRRQVKYDKISHDLHCSVPRVWPDEPNCPPVTSTTALG